MILFLKQLMLVNNAGKVSKVTTGIVRLCYFRFYCRVPGELQTVLEYSKYFLQPWPGAMDTFG